jgi:hypothetical protein
MSAVDVAFRLDQLRRRHLALAVLRMRFPDMMLPA